MIRISLTIILLQCLLYGPVTGEDPVPRRLPPAVQIIYGQCQNHGFPLGDCDNNWKNGELNCASLCCVDYRRRRFRMNCSHRPDDGTRCSAREPDKVCLEKVCQKVHPDDVPRQITRLLTRPTACEPYPDSESESETEKLCTNCNLL